jgi:hypothetical protein
MKVLNYSNLKNALTSWNYDCADIPNQDGLAIVVKLNNGLTVLTSVISDDNQFHTLKDVKICDVQAWRNATPEDMTIKPE